MDKKGVLRTVVGVAILLVFLAVVLVFIIGPEAILPKAATAGEWIADNTLGTLRKDKVEKSPLEVPNEIEETYENILSVLRTEGNGPCILKHESLPKDFKGYKIILSTSDQGIFAYLMDEKGQRLKPTNIAGKFLCVVGEGDATKNFYDNYLGGTICATNCLEDYSRVNEIVFGKKNYVNGQDRKFEDENLVFKTEDGNVCFIPLRGDMFWSGGCDRYEDIIDKDCIKNIKENIDLCEE